MQDGNDLGKRLGLPGDVVGLSVGHGGEPRRYGSGQQCGCLPIDLEVVGDGVDEHGQPSCVQQSLLEDGDYDALLDVEGDHVVAVDVQAELHQRLVIDLHRGLFDRDDVGDRHPAGRLQPRRAPLSAGRRPGHRDADRHVEKGDTQTGPQHPLDSRQPGPRYQPNPAAPKFYAIRKGGDSKGYKDDFLLLPTNRIKGIECPFLEDGSQLNLWSAAWFQIPNYVATNPAKPFALGVNSAQSRGQDQLHIHLAQVYPPTLADLKAIPNPQTNLNNWMSTDVRLRINPHFSGGTRHFRVVKYRGTMPDLFKQLKRVLPAGETMDIQSIGVVYAGTPNTWYLLNSTRKFANDGTGLMDVIYGWKHK